MLRFLNNFSYENCSVTLWFDEHLHVDNIISSIHKVKDTILLDSTCHMLTSADNFNEVQNGHLILVQDWVEIQILNQCEMMIDKVRVGSWISCLPNWTVFNSNYCTFVCCIFVLAPIWWPNLAFLFAILLFNLRLSANVFKTTCD